MRQFHYYHACNGVDREIITKKTQQKQIAQPLTFPFCGFINYRIATMKATNIITVEQCKVITLVMC